MCLNRLCKPTTTCQRRYCNIVLFLFCPHSCQHASILPSPLSHGAGRNDKVNSLLYLSPVLCHLPHVIDLACNCVTTHSKYCTLSRGQKVHAVPDSCTTIYLQVLHFWMDVSTCCIGLYLRNTHFSIAARSGIPEIERCQWRSIYTRAGDLGGRRLVFRSRNDRGNTSIPSSLAELIGAKGRLLRHASTCVRIVENSSNVSLTGEMTCFRWFLTLFTADSHISPK